MTAVTPRTDKFRTYHKRVTSSRYHKTHRIEGTDKQRRLLLWMSYVTFQPVGVGDLASRGTAVVGWLQGRRSGDCTTSFSGCGQEFCGGSDIL